MFKTIALGVLALSVSGTAEAQFGFGSGSQRIQRPLGGQTVSPYVNLLRGGGTGLNYYGIVRPEQQFGASIQQLQGGIGGGARRGGRSNTFGLGGGMGTTGHPVVFDSFRQQGGFGGGGGGGFGGGLGGGGVGFQPGFLGQGAGGNFGGFNVGGSGGSSFSPIEGGALSGAGLSGGGNFGGGNFGGGGGALFGGGGGGANLAGGGAGIASGNIGGSGGRRTPWGVGVPSFNPGIGSTGHPVRFDSFRQNSGFGGQ